MIDPAHGTLATAGAGEAARTEKGPRTIFVVTSLARGGSEGQLVELVCELAPRLRRAVVVTIAPEADAGHLETLRRAQVEVSALAPPGVTGVRRLIIASVRLNRLLRVTEAELVYAWGPHPSVIGVPVARRAGRASIVRRGQVGLEGPPRRAFDRLTRGAERRAGLVTANSAAVAADALGRGIGESRLRLVPNGHRRQEKLPPPSPGPVVLGYMAHFRPGKGHERLLEAIPRVDARVPWRIDLAGGGPLLERVRDEVKRRGLEHRVRFLGVVRDAQEFWRSRHGAVLLSDAEGCPNVLIEAGLAGRPLVATDVAGNAALVVPSAGLLVPVDDPAATARALAALIDDPQLRERLGQGAHERMRAFDLATMVDGHLAAIQQAWWSATAGA